jgi:CIC family chloride channel protein
MRSPFTGFIFALELTHDINILLPLLIACTMAHGFTVLVMRRSILTEKVSRRGYHLTREYAIDPLEILFVREVMRTTIVALSAELRGTDLAQALNTAHQQQGQHLYPVVDGSQRLRGVLTRSDLTRLLSEEPSGLSDQKLAQLVKPDPVVCYPDEPLRFVVYRMAETNLTRFPVVERAHPDKLVGMISLTDLLKARARTLHEERSRERVLRLRTLFPRGNRTLITEEKVALVIDRGDPEDAQEQAT